MSNLSDTVIKNGFCIGCGVCSAINNSPFHIKQNKFGMFAAANANASEEPELATNVCPFSSTDNEDIIAKEVLDIKTLNYNEDIGYFSNLYAGFVLDEKYRLASSSGGLLSWTIEQLFNNNLIDAVIHVKTSKKNSVLFEYEISENIDAVREGKGSRYYPVEMSHILEIVKNTEKRYAVVGIPCFIKGLRLLKKNDTNYSNLKFFIGIICGQLKSANYTKFIANQFNISPASLININYREKKPNTSASGYCYKLKYKKNKSILETLTEKASSLYGNDWGMGMFKYKSCDVCDDVFNETADVVFGDAWIKQYLGDWQGTNIVITKNIVFQDIITAGSDNQSIQLNELTVEEITNSQLANIRHRKQLINYRLIKFKKNHDWVPIKRLYNKQGIPKKNILRIQDLRMIISKKSHLFYYKSQNINLFKLRMSPYFINYKISYYGFNLKFFIPESVLNFIRRLVK
jgi:coenzyme F420 hydrogenase subunit beta